MYICSTYILHILYVYQSAESHPSSSTIVNDIQGCTVCTVESGQLPTWGRTDVTQVLARDGRQNTDNSPLIKINASGRNTTFLSNTHFGIRLYRFARDAKFFYLIQHFIKRHFDLFHLLQSPCFRHYHIWLCIIYYLLASDTMYVDYRLYHMSCTFVLSMSRIMG